MDVKGRTRGPRYSHRSYTAHRFESTKWFLNVCIFMWKRETNIHGALALVYFVDTARGLQKLNYWKTNFPRDFENIGKPTL
jgi:hypothetical protein